MSFFPGEFSSSQSSIPDSVENEEDMSDPYSDIDSDSDPDSDSDIDIEDQQATPSSEAASPESDEEEYDDTLKGEHLMLGHPSPSSSQNSVASVEPARSQGDTGKGVDEGNIGHENASLFALRSNPFIAAFTQARKSLPEGDGETDKGPAANNDAPSRLSSPPAHWELYSSQPHEDEGMEANDSEEEDVEPPPPSSSPYMVGPSGPGSSQTGSGGHVVESLGGF